VPENDLYYSSYCGFATELKQVFIKFIGKILGDFINLNLIG